MTVVNLKHNISGRVATPPDKAEAVNAAREQFVRSLIEEACVFLRGCGEPNLDRAADILTRASTEATNAMRSQL